MASDETQSSMTQTISQNQQSWDLSYLKLAMFWGNERSKDPSTKVGAVIVDVDNRVVGMGYNGFPRGVSDSQERYNDRNLKYELVVHAEVNALLNAGSNARGGTLYASLLPCSDCAKMAIQAGVRRVVMASRSDCKTIVTWRKSHKYSRIMYDEAGVQTSYYEFDRKFCDAFMDREMSTQSRCCSCGEPSRTGHT